MMGKNDLIFLTAYVMEKSDVIVRLSINTVYSIVQFNITSEIICPWRRLLRLKFIFVWNQ